MVANSLVERENHLRWDGNEAGHYEVYYMTFNHVESGSGFWIRYTMTAPCEGKGEPYAQVWFSYFKHGAPEKNFALKKKFPISELVSSQNPFELRIGKNIIASENASGSISGNGHEATWDLTFGPSERVHYMLPRFMYGAELADTLALNPHVNTSFHGVMTVDGERLEFNGDPGCQTHLWGEKHAVRWAWAHCNAFKEDDSAAFEGLSVQIERLGIKLPPMSLFAIWYGGKKYDLTGLSSVMTSSCKFETGKWRVHGKQGGLKFECEFTCEMSDLVCAEYYDPDGEKAWCHNTEVGRAIIKIFKPAGPLNWKLADTLTCPTMAHMEFAAREKDARVKKDIVEV